MKCSPGDKLASRWPKNVKNAVTHDAEMPVLPEKDLFGEGLVSERIDPASWPLPRHWELLRRLPYPFADAVVIQTERAKLEFSRKHPGFNFQVIPNGIPKALLRRSGFPGKLIHPGTNWSRAPYLCYLRSLK